MLYAGLGRVKKPSFSALTLPIFVLTEKNKCSSDSPGFCFYSKLNDQRSFVLTHHSGHLDLLNTDVCVSQSEAHVKNRTGAFQRVCFFNGDF